MRKTNLGVTVKAASQQLGIPEPAVRVLMRRGKLPIGIAEAISGKRVTYYISQELIDKYLGKEILEKSEQPQTENAAALGGTDLLPYGSP